MSNDNIISEINEELRSDMVRNFWRRFGPLVIAAAVCLVLGVAGWQTWSWWTATSAAKSSDEFYAALKLADGGDYAGAQKALDTLSTTGFGGYPQLAKFRGAALLAQQGKTAEAVAAYDALAGTEPNQHLREVAQALAGLLLVDSGDVAQVTQRLGTMAAGSSAMRNVAREALGLVNVKAGQPAEAQKQFQAIINDVAAGTDQKQRVGLYQAQLVAQGTPIPVEAAAPADGAAASATETKPAN